MTALPIFRVLGYERQPEIFLIGCIGLAWVPLWMKILTKKEPEKTPSPQPTIEVYMRGTGPDGADVLEHSSPPSQSSNRDHAWNKVSIRLVGSHPLWGHHL